MSKISQEKIDYIKNHLDVPNNKLAEILNIDRSTVRKYKKLEGVVYQPKDYHKYDKYIISNYYDKKIRELAEEIGCSKSYISKIWRENGLSGKDTFRYNFNFNYFKKIDSANKAYILGLIASDGCIYKRENHQGQLSFQLQKTDIQILEDIKKEMESTHPINIYGKMASLVLINNELVNDLEKIGLHPRKTWVMDINMIINHIPDNFVSDFFRGYFDGDGSIESSDDFKTISRTRIRYAVPRDTGHAFEKILLKYHLIGHYEEDLRDKNYLNSFGTFIFNNTTEKYCFLKWIYNSVETYSSLTLERKYILSKKFIDKVENNSTNRSENLQALKIYKGLILNGNQNKN